MITLFAQCAKSIMTCRANAHGCVWLHHNGGATALPGTVNYVGHEVQAGLEQQTVVTGKQFLVHQLLHLEDKDRQGKIMHYK